MREFDDEENPPLKGRCPECGLLQPLQAPDDISAHLGPDGEFCPGSRGKPE